MIKVFISHQKADSLLAGRIAAHLLSKHSIESYLDLIDTSIAKGEDLAAHLRSQMGACTQLLAVVSASTLASQWVPWEIGVATEKEYPLATYSDSSVPPPEFLQKWPYLRTTSDLDSYARTSKAASETFTRRKAILRESVETARATATRQFYTDLRRSLGQ